MEMWYGLFPGNISRLINCIWNKTALYEKLFLKVIISVKHTHATEVFRGYMYLALVSYLITVSLRAAICKKNMFTTDNFYLTQRNNHRSSWQPFFNSVQLPRPALCLPFCSWISIFRDSGWKWRFPPNPFSWRCGCGNVVHKSLDGRE
jgi:hypothetical protein